MSPARGFSNRERDTTYLLIDTPIRVVCDTEEIADVVDHLLGDLVGPDSTPPAHSFRVAPGYRLYEGGSLVSVSDSLSPIVSQLVARMNRLAIQEADRLAVHAGVVGLGYRVVAFPAESGKGKTTMTAACLLEGFTYWSDEALVFDEPNIVVPYPKPLALTPWSLMHLGFTGSTGERLVAAADLGAPVADTPVPLTDVVLLRPGPIGLESLPRSAAVSELLRLSFNHYRYPEGAVRTVIETARRVHVRRLSYSDTREGARLLAARLS